MLELKEVRSQINNAWDQYRLSLKEAEDLLESEIQRIESLCPHKRKWHGDPSGNNDSYADCEYCGKIL